MKAPRPKKRFGQNYLIDQNVISEIISELKICNDDTFLEIGAGDGPLTEKIFHHLKKMLALQIDPQLVNKLTQNKNLTQPYHQIKRLLPAHDLDPDSPRERPRHQHSQPSYSRHLA